VLVSAAGLRMTYRSRAGAVVALDDVTLAVRRHEFLSVVGPSGCGKTTLLLLAAGLLTPSAGELRIEDRRLAAPYTDAAIVFQHDNLLEWRTVLDNVLLPAAWTGLPTGGARASCWRWSAWTDSNGHTLTSSQAGCGSGRRSAARSSTTCRSS
jgi:NitT/TauT family transport system ATP-binding protein